MVYQGLSAGCAKWLFISLKMGHISLSHDIKTKGSSYKKSCQTTSRHITSFHTTLFHTTLRGTTHYLRWKKIFSSISKAKSEQKVGIFSKTFQVLTKWGEDCRIVDQGFLPPPSMPAPKILWQRSLGCTRELYSYC